MFSKLTFKRCFFAALALFAWSGPSVAQLGVTFGFDSGTKDLIQGLPDNIRQQIEKAVADILPMIDKKRPEL